MKKALICGISGQDGAYLAHFLLSRGYSVYGTSRDAQITSFNNLIRLGIADRVNIESVSLNDFRSVLQVLVKIEPDEVYNLAGQSSVGLSFDQPVETLESISIATLNLLESIRFLDKPIKIYNAGSGDCFGDTDESGADEKTPFRPRSPYAVAKAASFWEVANYREAYGLFACNGILFNHESPLRPQRFVTRKVVSTARRISQGSPEKLHLGNISIKRDWGWAQEFVEAMWLMLQKDSADDYVIATGESHSLEEFVAVTFSSLGLHWRDHVVLDDSLLRPTDIRHGCGNPSKAEAVLGWKAKYNMEKVIKEMLSAEGKENLYA